eukprot:355701-Pyramimonas_sp.AAC.1
MRLAACRSNPWMTLIASTVKLATCGKVRRTVDAADGVGTHLIGEGVLQRHQSSPGNYKRGFPHNVLQPWLAVQFSLWSGSRGSLDDGVPWAMLHAKCWELRRGKSRFDLMKLASSSMR